MRKSQVERMNKVNELIEFISGIDRRFFYNKSKDKVAKFVEGKTTVFYIDDYTQETIHLRNVCKDRGFSHGGTLWGLVHDFKEWIITGKHSNGRNGYGGLYCPHWGYTEEGMKKIQEKGKEIGFLKS
jgi:elongation factor P hydroxylase